MSYERYKNIITRKLSAFPANLLNDFCQDVALRIIPFVDRADKSNLWPRELELIDSLANMVRDQCVDWKLAGGALDELTKIAKEDDVHTIEVDGDLIEFLSAMDSWREVTASGQIEAAAAVSENIMNILDFHFVKDTPLDQWLSVQQLREELTTQVKFLEDKA